MNDSTVAITAKDIRSYQELAERTHGYRIDKEQATHELNMLLRQMQRVYRPVKAEQIELLKNEEQKCNEPAEPASTN